MPRAPKEDPASIYTKKVCKEWIKDPLHNPLAKKKHVLKEGDTGVYGKLKKNCKELHGLEPKDISKTKQKQLTLEDCKTIHKNPTKNPLTGRKIDPNKLHGIYQQLLVECAKLQEEVEKRAKPSDEPYQPSEEDTKKLQKIRLRNALRAALRPILHHRDSLENRIHMAKVVRKYVDAVSPCIYSSQEKKQMLVLAQEETKPKKIFREKIYFNQRIGSDSVYGTAYLNAGKGLGRLLKFSAKVMGDNFQDEVYHLHQMSRLAEYEFTPNMPITYDILHCKAIPKTKQSDLATNQVATALTKRGHYFVVLNELANGDMHDFFKYKYAENVYESVLFQLILSLRSFHKYIHYIHNDAHLGNFLYHKVQPGGFWHYRYKGTDIFVPNTGYLVVLWDPGMAKPIFSTIFYNAQHPTTDYLRVLPLVGSIGGSNFYIQKKMLPVPSTTFLPFEDMIRYLQLYPHTELMDYIISRKNKYLKHIYFDQKQLPANAIVLNKKPYMLS